MTTTSEKSLSGEEIPKSQAQINEEIFRFQAELKSEMARAKMKLDVILAMVMESRKSTSKDPPQTTESDGILFTSPSSSKPQLVKAESDALFEQDDCEIELPMVSMDLHSDNTSGVVHPIKEQQVEESDCSVFGKMIVQNGAHKVFDKMSESILGELDVYDMGIGANKDQLDTNEGQMNGKYIRAALLEEHVIDLSAQDVDLINLFLFDPGGDKIYAYGLSEGNIRPLVGKAHETYHNGMEEIDWGKIVMKNDADRVLEEMSTPNSLTMRETFSVVNVSNKGFSIMLDTKQFQASETVTERDKVLKGTCVTS